MCKQANDKVGHCGFTEGTDVFSHEYQVPNLFTCLTKISIGEEVSSSGDFLEV